MIGIALILAASCAMAKSPWSPASYQRAKDLVSKMNTSEIFQFVHGWPSSASSNLKGFNGYVGGIPGLARLNIPYSGLEDGPQGVADGVRDVTAWPSALTVVASWDPDLYQQYGVAMGAEQRIKGSTVMLGPMSNLLRVPVDGRAFESTGADPVLASAYTAALTTGIQSNKVLACIKHFIDNNNEFERSGVSETVGARAQYELYYPAFEASVNAGAGTAMCSYNKVNLTWACENNETIRWLKEEAGFDGWLMSDWGATHSTIPSALAGLDAEMPSDGYFGASLVQAVQNGDVPMSRVEDMVVRLLTPYAEYGILDDPPTGNLSVNAMSKEHNELARTLAANSHILLKNEGGVLPFPKTGIKSIAVIGDATSVTGGGSGHVITPYVVTPQQGISTAVNGDLPSHCVYYNNTDFYQPGNPEVSASSPEDCCTQCSQTPGCNAWTFEPPGSCWIKPDTAGNQTHDGLTSGTCQRAPGAVNVTYNDGTDPAAAAALAKSADFAVVVVATTSHEGADRANLSLPDFQNAYVSAVLAAQPKTAVIVRSPAAVLMPWLDQAPAVIETIMPGQEAGNALADVIFGDVNPSGKLPYSIPSCETCHWLKTPEQYPGVKCSDPDGNCITYTESLNVDYRYYHNKSATSTPTYWFGHGLSYTTFTYSDLQITGSAAPYTVTAKITNSGSRKGSEVAQLYLSFPPQYEEPPYVLRAFAKAKDIAPSQSTTVSFTLDERALSYFDVVAMQWKLPSGTVDISVGASSNDFRLRGSINL